MFIKKYLVQHMVKVKKSSASLLFQLEVIKDYVNLTLVSRKHGLLLLAKRLQVLSCFFYKSLRSI